MTYLKLIESIFHPKINIIFYFLHYRFKSLGSVRFYLIEIKPLFRKEATKPFIK